MALKRRRDNKMWREYSNFNFIVIISGLLYLILFVTSEPVCYTRVSLDERSLIIKRVDCDGTETICKRFASQKDVKVGDLLDSPCRYPEAPRSTHKNDTEATTCQDVHLPNVNAGFFNCSGYSVGDKCNLTCDNGYYPSATKYAVCEVYDDHKANWTVGNFQCSATTCQGVHLPNVNAGFFNCSGYSVGDKCNLTCDNGYYPSATKYAVCEVYDDHKANWTVGNFQCSAMACSTKNLSNVEGGSFGCDLNSDISKGEASTLTCNDGFYPVYSSRAVCEAETSNQIGAWSYEKIECCEITCSTKNLPTVEGLFDCDPDTDIPKGEACNLTCNSGLYPAYSRQAVCEAGIPNQGGVWSDGSFVCRRLKCNEWNDWNGGEYKFISTGNTWEGSRQLCQNDSSHLVSIEDKEENEFVSKMARSCNKTYVAIGLNDLNTEGKWEWSDGTVSTYRNWNKGQPNKEEQDCVFIDGRSGEWHDLECAKLRLAVCERNNSVT